MLDADDTIEIGFKLLFDADYIVHRLAGPHGVRVYPTANPASSWTFTMIGFSDQPEALMAASAEVTRRQRAGQWPPEGC